MYRKPKANDTDQQKEVYVILQLRNELSLIEQTKTQI